jgi:hypothetical protein
MELSVTDMEGNATTHALPIPQVCWTMTWVDVKRKNAVKGLILSVLIVDPKCLCVLFYGFMLLFVCVLFFYRSYDPDENQFCQMGDGCVYDGTKCAMSCPPGVQ